MKRQKKCPRKNELYVLCQIVQAKSFTLTRDIFASQVAGVSPPTCPAPGLRTWSCSTDVGVSFILLALPCFSVCNGKRNTVPEAVELITAPTLTTSSPDRDRHLLVHQVNICLGTSFSLG